MFLSTASIGLESSDWKSGTRPFFPKTSFSLSLIDSLPLSLQAKVQVFHQISGTHRPIATR
jgi:hypothetical protein